MSLTVGIPSLPSCCTGSLCDLSPGSLPKGISGRPLLFLDLLSSIDRAVSLDLFGCGTWQVRCQIVDPGVGGALAFGRGGGPTASASVAILRRSSG